MKGTLVKLKYEPTATTFILGIRSAAHSARQIQPYRRVELENGTRKNLLPIVDIMKIWIFARHPWGRDSTTHSEHSLLTESSRWFNYHLYHAERVALLTCSIFFLSGIKSCNTETILIYCEETAAFFSVWFLFYPQCSSVFSFSCDVRRQWQSKSSSPQLLSPLIQKWVIFFFLNLFTMNTFHSL